ncbi:MAG: aminoacyl-tRNA hydrolase [Clostridia bacterium]|nr:aminoacyl-tRNA hydrolase [Clostridia bacterium]
MIIVGLGNYGETYANTFHNMGFMCIDKLAEKLNIKIDKNECDSLTGVKSINGKKIVLAKPQTYMNLSGKAVKGLLKKYDEELDNLIVIYDDIDIPRFSVRIRNNGSAGTHNGMRDIIEKIQSEKFLRIRIGIGKAEFDLASYVLSKIKKEDIDTFNLVYDDVTKVLIEYIKDRDYNKLSREGNIIKH